MRYVDSLDDVELWELVVGKDGILQTCEGDVSVPIPPSADRYAVLDIADVCNLLTRILPAYDQLERKTNAGNFGIQVSHDNEKTCIIEFSKVVQKFGINIEDAESFARSLLQACKALKTLRPRIMVPNFEKRKTNGR